MPDPTPQQKLLLDELNGKKFAVQTYDDRIWAIRSGALTLTFAAWGAAIAVGENLDTLKSIAWVLAGVSIALLITGFVIELFYVIRKYRCIDVLDKYAKNIYDWMQVPPKNSSAITTFLNFSGDDSRIELFFKSDKKLHLVKLLEVFGEGVLIYFIPSVVFAVAADFLS